MRNSNCGRVLLVGASVLVSATVWAQQPQIPQKPAPMQVSGDVAVTYSAERSQIVPSQCCFWLQGGGADGAVTFWKGLGVAAGLTGDHISNYAPGMDINKIAFLAGPRYTYTGWTHHAGADERPRYQVFGQGLFGAVHAFDGFFPTSTGSTPTAGSFAVQAGGGVNLFLASHLGVRLLEADFVRTALPNNAGNVQHDMRLSFGITYHFATAAPPPATLACSANPTSVFPGDPVTIIATAGALAPKQNAIFSWAGSGVTGNGTTATVATASLPAGSYTVTGTVKQGKPGKEGLRAGQTAECSASFTVKAYEPPTLSCSANPGTIKPGETAAITAMGMSPQNRPLTYSYSASAGAVSGSGTQATFSSTGAPSGAVGITCNVSDDKGQTATANATLTILPPYIPPAPHTQALCSIAFEKDSKRPARVDNEAKACLDDVALNLQKQPGARAFIVGEANAVEQARAAKAAKAEARKKHPKPVENLAAERAVNTKEYLVTDKGIDASRVAVAIGATDAQKVEDYLVPAGASFTADVQGTAPVDETVVKPQVRKPLAEKLATTKR